MFRLLRSARDRAATRILGAVARRAHRAAFWTLCGYLSSPSPSVRRDAARELGRLGDGRAIARLQRLLEDPDASVRNAANRALELLRVPPSFQLPRSEAADRMKQRRDELEALGEALRSADASERMSAAKRLGELGDRNAAPLLAAAIGDPVVEVTERVCAALGKLGGSTALPGLADAVRNRAGYFHPSCRIAAARALGRLARDPRCQHAAIEALAEGVRDPIVEVSEAAIEALGTSDDARVTAILRGVLDDTAFFAQRAREAARRALEARGDAAALAGAIGVDVDGGVESPAAS